MGFSLGDLARIGLGIGTLGASEVAYAGYKALTKGPNPVNYQGKELSDQMKDFLDSLSEGSGGQGFPGFGAPAKRAGNPLRAQEIMRNWLFGPPVKPLDPTLAFSSARALGGAQTQAGLGMGMSGAFNFGLPMLPSLDLGPMMRGVPYTVPPLPTLRANR